MYVFSIVFIFLNHKEPPAANRHCVSLRVQVVVVLQ